MSEPRRGTMGGGLGPTDAAIAHAVVEAISMEPTMLQRLAEALEPYVVRATTNESRDGEWLESKQAAAHLGLTVNAIHKLTAARTIPFEQEGPGCKCWFRRTELDAWRRGGDGTPVGRVGRTRS